MNSEVTLSLITAFVTVFFVFGLGFLIQRLRPLSEETLGQLSALVVDTLLPVYLFYTTATGVTVETLGAAPALIAMGIIVPLISYLLATLALKPAGVAPEQQEAFRFAAIMANTAFLGFPISEALFGSVGLIYAVLYDFGNTLIVLTFGIWALSGGRFNHWRPLIFNPLIIGVMVGLAWAFTGWSFPGWLAPPFEALGGATLPMALLVGGAQVSNIGTIGRAWRQQLTGLGLVRLVIAPLLIGLGLALLGWDDMAAAVVILMAAMPAGLTVSIMARTYDADARFGAAATLWTTLAAVFTLPLITFMVVDWFGLG